MKQHYIYMYIVVASAILILFSTVYQGTYSYFVSGISDQRQPSDGTTSLKAADLQNLVMAGNNEGMDNWIPGDSKDFTFTVTNPGSGEVCFDLMWEDVVNEFVNKNDLKITLKDSSNNVLAEDVFPSVAGSLATGVKIAANQEETYTLTILYENTEENQFGDMGKEFSATISGQMTVCRN